MVKDDLFSVVSDFCVRSEELGQALPYYHTLFRIRSALESSLVCYPLSWCGDASRMVRHVLGTEHGIEMISGYYTFDRARHAWNYDLQRKLYIDLTLDQFYRGFPRVAIMKDDVSFLDVNEQGTHLMRSFPDYDQIDVLNAFSALNMRGAK